MLHIRIDFETNDNSAFAGDDESCRAAVARLLTTTAANLLEPGRYGSDDYYPLLDVNGNNCGSIWLDEVEDEDGD
ncbi:MAG: hypothetical protein WC248_08685 [Candidatus Methanomethylophilaceae archaeon]|jgi:hypothetical protein